MEEVKLARAELVIIWEDGACKGWIPYLGRG